MADVYPKIGKFQGMLIKKGSKQTKNPGTLASPGFSA
jgi:hypothetical protein